ncbi:MAG: carboxypeptidase regulatory-like domain-containing protein [Verrucomicrobia bacterium]|nr:carboxypeptidase regulatory-like domain-containing protein [Verrucomicrobiota bacterium]
MKIMNLIAPHAGRSRLPDSKHPQSPPLRPSWRSRGLTLAAKSAACCAAVCFAGLSSASATDFILNGDFEGTGGTPNPGYVTGFAQYTPASLYWPWSAFGNTGTGGGFEQPNGVGRYANPSVDANNPSATVWEDFGNPTYVNTCSQNFMSDVWLIPGATYQVHAQYYVPSSEVQAGVTPIAGIYLTMYDGSQRRLLDPRYTGTTPNDPRSAITVLDAWHTIDLDWVNPGTVPERLNYGSFRLYSWNGAALGTQNPGGYFDNLQISSAAYTGTLSGLVKNSSGPLEGATITVNYSGSQFRTSPREVATPVDGTYSLAGLIDGGSFDVTASRTGYLSKTVTVTASSVVPDITLDPAPTYTRYECESHVAFPSVNMGVSNNALDSNGARAAKQSQGGTGTLTIPVTVVSTGQYDMQMVTYFTGRQTFISVNGTNVASSPVASSNPDANGYCHNSVPVVLKAGSNTITLYNNIDWGPHWDYIDLADVPTGVAWLITSSVGTGDGTISPLGEVAVADGASQTYTVTPAFGWEIDTVTVDASPISDPYSVTPTADSAVVANFKVLNNLQPVSGNVSDSVGGIAGATVHFSLTPGGALASTTTTTTGADPAGDYSKDLPPGDYYIAATAPGYMPSAELGPVTVGAFPAGGNNFTLTATGLPTGAVAWWSFDDTLADPIGGNTLKGATGTVAYGAGNMGSASLYVDGNTTLDPLSGTFPTGVPTGASSYTVAAYIKADTGCPGNGGWIGYGTANSPNLANNFRLDGWSPSAIWNYWHSNDMGATLASGTFFDGWHSVIGTWNGTTEKLYLDGVERATRDPGTPPNFGSTSFIVGRTLNDSNFKGWIDDLLILDRAMDATEAAAYNTLGARSLAPSVNIAASKTGGGNGTITPSGTAVPVTVGSSKTFTITPAYDSYIADVSVTENGLTESKGAVATYTFNNVLVDGSIVATIELKDTGVISGVVSDGSVGINGAKVYFKLTANASQNPMSAYTVTTSTIGGIDGSYAQTLPVGEWYVAAGAAGYDVSADQVVTLTTAGAPADFALVANPNWDVFFMATVDQFSAFADGDLTGNWTPSYVLGSPAGAMLNAIDTPRVVTVDGVKWIANTRSEPGFGTDGNDGFNLVNCPFTVQPNAGVDATGVSVVAVVQPTYWFGGGEARGSIVNLYYNGLDFCVDHATGEVMVARKAWDWQRTGTIIPEGQKTVLALVCQLDGSAKLYVNGLASGWSGAALGTNYYADLTGGDGRNSWQNLIGVGRNVWDGWSAFSGNIGDVYVYRDAISDAKRTALESSLGAKFGIPLGSSNDYASWAAINAPDQTPGEDYNNDGVENGVAYFMGVTGLATNPGLDASNTVTWPVSPTFMGDYEVQTSPDLSTWTNYTPKPALVGGNLTFTLPPGLGQQFVRLLVIPN